MRHLKYLFLIIPLVISLGAQGQSPDAPISRINALLCEPLPAPLEVDLQILDDGYRFGEFKDLFEKKLLARSVGLSRTAAMIATLDITTVREIQVDPKDPAIDARTDQENSRIGEDNTIFKRGNVWSNKEKSILERKKGQSEKLSLNQLQVSISINRRIDGRCLWQGEVLHGSPRR